MRSMTAPSLTRVYFQGNAPTPTNDSTVFSGDPATVYYLPGTTGWGAMFDGLPTAPWFLPNPQILTGNNPASACKPTGLVSSSPGQRTFPSWWKPPRIWPIRSGSPVSTNTLTGGTYYFSDPQWTNYPAPFLSSWLAIKRVTPVSSQSARISFPGEPPLVASKQREDGRRQSAEV